MKYLREFLGIVAGDYNFVSSHFVEHILALQQALREPRLGQRKKCVQLSFVFVFLARRPSHHDAAGTDVKPDRLRITSSELLPIFFSSPELIPLLGLITPNS